MRSEAELESGMTSGIARMEIGAPLSGVVVPLDCVPDPVFSRKMAGDGIAIEPTSNEVLAPVSGIVSQLHRAHHAVAITADNGIEVLVHVGLDTVALDGRGFTPLVAKGARVERGQPVLRFDADAIACQARSLLTVVVVSNDGRVSRLLPARGLVVAGASTILELELVGSSRADADPEPGASAVSEAVCLPNTSGLHARPAAVLAEAAKKFEGTIRLVRGSEEANAKSVVAILGLSTRHGDTVRIKANGADASRAAAALAKLLAEGCGEDPDDGPRATAAAPVPAQRVRALRPELRELAGVPTSPGLAIGKVFQFRHVAIDVEETDGSPDEERARLHAAIREAARQLDALKGHSPEGLKAQIMGVHLALLEDPDLVELAEGLLESGKSAAFSWRQAFSTHAERLEKLGNALLRERAADLRDVGRRVLTLLAHAGPAELVVPEGAVLIAEELTPSDTASFDRTRLLGFCTTTGGSTNHVAILARAMGIPAICGIDEAALSLPDGMRVAIDGTHGLLRLDPDESHVARLRERVAHQAARRKVEESAAIAPAQTRDGHRVEVVANIRNAKEALEAVAAGAEGVGLLRSEFLFDHRDEPPTEDEQAAEYSAVASALGKERRFVVRTLDVGGDKPLSYLPLPKESNPFLGLRGVRVSLSSPELFRAQLRAILRAAPLGDVHIMFPMIATLDELRAAKQILAEEQKAFPHAVKVGAMVEVPSAAVMAEALAREVDFFSVGTNDLTQYTLAMDRGHPKLARYADALHPAVLRLIAMTVEGAHEHGKWVGVCGGLASDTLAVALLAGLGVDELSVDVPAIAPVKAALARWSLDECTALATEVLRLRTATEVRAFLMARIEATDLVDGKQVIS